MRKSYFNIFLDVVNKDDALKICSDVLSGDTCKSIFFVNAHCFNVAQINAEYRNALNKSDYIFNDGIGIKIGSYLANVHFKDNLNGTDLIPEIIQSGVKKNKRIYLVGSSEGAVQRAKLNLEKQYHNINIVGTWNGFFSTVEEEQIISDINFNKADILIVGMGVPMQELWISKIRNRLTNVQMCIAGGAIIDFIAGDIKRAPLWMRKLNMEWIYRLYLEPRRMWKRYLIGNFLFLLNAGKLLFKKLL